MARDPAEPPRPCLHRAARNTHALRQCVSVRCACAYRTTCTQARGRRAGAHGRMRMHAQPGLAWAHIRM